MPNAAASPAKLLAGLVLDPVRFSRGLLLHDPWSTQRAILESVATHRSTAVKACHASGKTHTAADAVLWWVVRYADGIVVTTAPTWTQVERLLWGEIRKSYGGGLITGFPPISKTEIPLGPGNYAIGLSTNEGVRFQGWHGRILIVLDEAPGVLPEIYEAIEGIRAGGQVHVLLLGNPIVGAGPFYDAFTNNAGRWNRFTISAFDTPNLKGVTLERLLAMSDDELDTNPRPYLTTRRWVREKYDEWGPTHPLWEAKVLGQFPTQSEDALISLAWLDAAKARRAAGHELEAGIDVAGPGEDETVLCVRAGGNIVKLQAWADRDARGPVAAALLPYKNRKIHVNVDSVGMGHYFALHLEDLGYEVTHVNVGDAAWDDTKYANRKAELYWGLRLRFEALAVGGLVDPLATGQLSTIRYSHNARGQVVIESKEHAAKRGIRSPDRAEAIMLAFAPRPQKQDLDPSKWRSTYA